MLLAVQDQVVKDLTTTSREEVFEALYIILLRDTPLVRYWRGQIVSRVRQRLEWVGRGRIAYDDFDDDSTTTKDGAGEAEEVSVAMRCPRELFLGP